MIMNSVCSSNEALKKLLDGNERYVKGELTHVLRIDDNRRQSLTDSQSPFAAILCCADSRTPPEHIFDGALGELFVLRNAGNIVDEVVLGSLEYAVAHTGCPLIAVMGHNRCGAVGAAVAAAKDPGIYETHNIDDIVRRLLPAVIATREGQPNDGAWIDAAARKNVTDTVLKITRQSQLIAKKLDEGDFMIVGTWYDLESGKVTIIK